MDIYLKEGLKSHRAFEHSLVLGAQARRLSDAVGELRSVRTLRAEEHDRIFIELPGRPVTPATCDWPLPREPDLYPVGRACACLEAGVACSQSTRIVNLCSRTSPWL